jgi:hypothetical protein
LPQATLTIVTEVTREEELEALLKAFRDGLPKSGEPFSLVKGLHFARFAVVLGCPEHNLAPQLVFALIFDGAPRDCIAQVVEVARAELDAIYAYCPDYKATDDAQKVTQYLLDRDRKPALFYQGTEDLNVETIKAMPDIRDALRARLDVSMEHGGAAESTFSLAAEARSEYLALPGTIKRIKVPPTERISQRAIEQRTWMWKVLMGVAALAFSFFPVIVGYAICRVYGWTFHPWFVAFAAFPLGLPALELVRRESVEKKRQRGRTIEVKETQFRQVIGEEDIEVQNALTHCAVVNGYFRQLVLYVVFWVIKQRVGIVDRLAGSLGGITSIHFGRWVLIDPGKRVRRLVFLSDYDGSWESYLGEFVDRAAAGLSAVWSNTEDFPPTRLLVFDGARDEQKFKAWTRAKQRTTPFWYSAYPQQTLRNIENNLQIVRGASKDPDPPREPAWLASL